MNVCLLNDSFPPVIDGVANVVMNYAKIMTETLGANVMVGTPRYPDTDYDHYPYKVVAYPSLDTTGFIAGYRTGNPLAMREIEEMVRFGPDIIHSHCPAASTIMARILQNETGERAPIVFTYHTKFDVDIARAVGEGFLKKETIKVMVNNISACDEVWVVSHGAGENLKSLGYEGEPRVVSNGVDFPKGRVPADKVKEVVKDYDLPEGIPVFLFVGRMMKYKGLPLIIDAMKYLSDTGVDFRMVFIGGGADAEEMQQKVRDLGISLDITGEDGKVASINTEAKGRIIFTGPVRDREKLRAWNTRADLFLFPSVYDTNGIVVREAAACGLASVLIKDSCAAEGITHTRNGYLIEETAQSMAVLLADACSDMECVHQVGQNAMDEIYISWEQSTRDAYSRYEVLKEMQLDGTLAKRKRGASDFILETASNVVKGTEKVFSVPKSLYEGMRENAEKINENISEGWEELKGKIPDSVKEFGNNAKEFGASAAESVKESVKNGLKLAEEGLGEVFGKKGDE